MAKLEEPAFEIVAGGYAVLIYASGKVEYGEASRPVPRGTTVITNRIPALIADAVARAVKAA